LGIVGDLEKPFEFGGPFGQDREFASGRNGGREIAVDAVEERFEPDPEIPGMPRGLGGRRGEDLAHAEDPEQGAVGLLDRNGDPAAF
jgi:hypothetical protein